MSKKKPMTPAPHLVSDHAVVRYIERIIGIDIDEVRDAITEGREKFIASTRAANLIIPEKNMGLTIRDGVVVTVIALKTEGRRWK